MAVGDIGAIIDSLTFETGQAMTPNMVHVTGEIYAIAYTDVGNQGWIKTVSIDAAGEIGAAAIDEMLFDAVNGVQPYLTHVTGEIFAVAYSGAGNDGFVATVSINAAGAISDAVIDSLEFDTAFCSFPNIIRVEGEIYAISYQEGFGEGYIKTVSINAAGAISDAVIDSLKFAVTMGQAPNIIHVTGAIFAVAYKETDTFGWIATFSIGADGAISDAVIDRLQIDATYLDHANMVHVTGEIYAIVYEGLGPDGFIVTVSINADGAISNAVIDSYEFDPVACTYPTVVSISASVFAIVYTDTDGDGWLITLSIDDAGAITASLIDSFEFEADTCTAPRIMLIAGNVYVIVYSNASTYGVLKTIDIVSAAAKRLGHIMLIGVN